MWDTNKEKKKICTTLVQITEINEQITITDKQNISYTLPSTKYNLHSPQGRINKLSKNILANILPVYKDQLRNISRPKKNLYTVFTSKIKNNTTSTKQT